MRMCIISNNITGMTSVVIKHEENKKGNSTYKVIELRESSEQAHNDYACPIHR
jgi:hypothetical protein